MEPVAINQPISSAVNDKKQFIKKQPHSINFYKETKAKKFYVLLKVLKCSLLISVFNKRCKVHVYSSEYYCKLSTK